MTNSRSQRARKYVLGCAFALLGSACIGGRTFLVLAALLPAFEILPPESEPVALGVGCLLALISLLTHLWACASHNTLRPRRSAAISHRSANGPP